MAHIIAVANQKGGVGKTTTCVNLAAALADLAKRVLVIDLDPQGNATMGLGINSRELETSTCDWLLEDESFDQIVLQLETPRLDLLPSNTDLTAAEVELMETSDSREGRLKKLLATVADEYDFILIDCPPSLSILTVNALTAANGVLIPMQCEYYALEGLTSLLDTIKGVQKSVNPGLKIEGLLRTMFDIRNNLSSDVSAQLRDHFGDALFRTVVPRNVRVAEAPSHGQPVIHYDRSSRGAVAYLGLAGELIRRRRDQQGGKAA